MSFKRIVDCCHIGTFLLTVVIVVLMVFPPPHQPLEGLSMHWLMPSLLCVCLLAAAFLNFVAPDRQVHTDGLVIHYARYRWGVWWWQFKSVTGYVRSHIKNNAVSLPINGEHLGDPKFGKPKTLRVKYSYAGFTRIVILPEERQDSPSRLVLPEPELRNIMEKMMNEFPTV